MPFFLDLSSADAVTRQRLQTLVRVQLHLVLRPGEATPLEPHHVEALTSLLSSDDFERYVKHDNGPAEAEGGGDAGGEGRQQHPFPSAASRSGKPWLSRQACRKLGAKHRMRLKEFLRSQKFRAFLRALGGALRPPTNAATPSAAVKRNISTVQNKFLAVMKAAKIKKPLPQGSTARGTALRGDTIDIDLVARGKADIKEVIRAAKAGGFKCSRVFKLTTVEGGARVAAFVDPAYPQHPLEVAFFNNAQIKNAHVAQVTQLADVYAAYPESAEASRKLKDWSRTVGEFQGFNVPSIALEKLAIDSRHRGHDADTIFRDVMHAIANENAVRDLPCSMKGSYSWDLAMTAAQETLALLAGPSDDGNQH